MNSRGRVLSAAAAAIVVTSNFGCVEKAMVTVRYVVEPSQPLKPETTVYVMDARVNDVTDKRWSEVAANRIEGMLRAASDRHKAGIRLATRKHTAEVMKEQDLVAAGIIAPAQAAQAGKMAGAQAAIMSEINVKVDSQRKVDSTITGLAGGGGRHGGGGGIETGEVEGVSRQITVQTDFKLIDTTTADIWASYSPEPYTRRDSTSTSPIFGSSRGEGDLISRDEVIGEAVERGVLGFVSMIVPCDVDYSVTIESSGNKSCIEGVKALRADDYERALSHFKQALSEGEDHHAAFGAGVTCELLGRHSEALTYYRRAYGIAATNQYRSAKERLEAHVGRIRAS